MLEKLSDNPRFDKLQIIQLFEADINLCYGIYWCCQLMYHAKHHNTLANEQQGLRPGRSAQNTALLKQRTYKISQLSRTPFGTFYNNTAACYDCIVMPLAVKQAQQLGMPVNVSNHITCIGSLNSQNAFIIQLPTNTTNMAICIYTSNPTNHLLLPIASLESCQLSIVSQVVNLIAHLESEYPHCSTPTQNTNIFTTRCRALALPCKANIYHNTTQQCSCSVHTHHQWHMGCPVIQ